MSVILRSYQKRAVDDVIAYFARAKGNPLVVMPTGSGKSIVLAEVARRAMTEWPSTRILVATHRQELVAQDAQAILRAWPEADLGVYAAGLSMRQVRSLTVASIQSVCDKAALLGRVDLVFVDEAHLVPHGDHGMYRDLIRDLRRTSEHLKVIGYTATPYRLDGGSLCRGRDKIFTSVAHSADVAQLVRDGWLAPLAAPAVSVLMDTSTVAVRGGDFAKGELDAAVATDDYGDTRAALVEAIRLTDGRRARLIFCVSVEHAEKSAAWLRANGQPAEILTGDSTSDHRRSVVDRFRRGELPWLVGIDVLTTGFDAPVCDAIIVLRPTQSCGLHVQMLGRGMRVCDGKIDCLVLDYGGNLDRHGPVDDPRPHSHGSGAESTLTPGMRVCRTCEAEMSFRLRECSECGAMLVVPRPADHETKASTSAPMRSAQGPVGDWIEIRDTRAFAWRKKDKPPSLCLLHDRGFRSDVREWLCFEHGGYAAEKARRRWAQLGGLLVAPHTVEEAIERAPGELRRVIAVRMQRDGEYDRIVETKLAPIREPGVDDVEDAVEDAVEKDKRKMMIDDELPF